tara:strand:- start:252 stop:1100 length:849 start_codon:yes stop_codon:yes gene_type:complete
MFREIKKNSIPLILMNARITNKSFTKWSFFKNFSNDTFSKINIAYPTNTETMKYLKKLNVKKIKNIGNLKFTDDQDSNKETLTKSFLLKLKKRLIWVASSTHPSEEVLVGKTHLDLSKKFKNLLTIIIPRHINRVSKIKDDLTTMGLNTITRSSKRKIDLNTDIYLVDTYGETKKFFKIAKMIFIGGSIVNHGGQNPIEPARYGLRIVHGPNVRNFKDIFKFFKEKKLAFKINNQNQLRAISHKLLTKKKTKTIDLKKIGKNILKKSVLEINQIFVNEIKKT